MNIPRKYYRNLFGKMEGEELCRDILTKGLHRLMRKDCPNHREDLSFCHQCFQVRRLLGPVLGNYADLSLQKSINNKTRLIVGLCFVLAEEEGLFS
ncbi:hypothetical protein FHR29_000506 [Sphingobacterium sp. JUb56]|nr:hypothetical protein [Sphingobacterium sp. JUb56]